jgi:uncharacterized phage infection (PIP) family protein YhgE
LEPTPVVVSEVSSQADVKAALAVLGWTVSVESNTETLISDLEAAIGTIDEINPRIQEAIDLMDRGLALVEEMKETSALGTSVWDAATKRVESLEDFVDAAEALRNSLANQSERLSEGKTETQSTIQQFSEIRNEGSTTYGELPGTVNGAISVYESIVSDLDSIQTNVELIIEISGEARDVANEFPVIGAKVSAYYTTVNKSFGLLNELLTRLNNEIETLTSGLSGVQGTAESEANVLYGPISEAATGSEQSMSVAEIDTSVSAYGTASTGGSS